MIWAIATVLLASIAPLLGLLDPERTLSDLPAGSYQGAVELFATGTREVTVDASGSGAEIPYILPGPADRWAGSMEHTLRVHLPHPPGGRLVLRLRAAETHDVAPPKLVVRARNVVKTIQTRAGTGLPPPHEVRGVRSHYDVALPPAPPGPGPLILSITNVSGSWIMWERIQLVQLGPILAVEHLARGLLSAKPAAAVLAGSLGALALLELRTGPRDSRRGRRGRLAACGLGLVLLGALFVRGGGLPSLGATPRWAWFELPWVLLMLRGLGRSASNGDARPGAPAGRSAMLPGALGAAVLLLYLGTLSKVYHPDGIANYLYIAERLLRTAPWTELVGSVTPNHVLYELLPRLLRRALDALGIDAPMITPLQVANAAVGTTGVVAFFVALRRITRAPAALLAAAGLAVTGGYWEFSVEVEDMMPSIAFILLSFLALVVDSTEPAPRRQRVVVAGAMLALAGLAHLNNLLFLPVGLLVLLLRPAASWPRRCADAGLFAGLTGALLLLVFALVRLIGGDTIAHLPRWLLFQPVMGLWGAWRGTQNLYDATVGLRKVLAPFGSETEAQVLAAFVLAFGLAGMAGLAEPARRDAARARWAGVFLVWIAAFLPFTLWWTPYDEEFWIVFAIPLWGLAALALGRGGQRSPYLRWLVRSGGLAAVGALFWVNVHHEVLRTDVARNWELRKTLRLAERVRPGDLVVTLGFGWVNYYFPYFANGQVLTLLGEALVHRDADRVAESLYARVCDAGLTGRDVWVHAILEDPRHRVIEWEDVEKAGAAPEILRSRVRRLTTVPAFNIEGERFSRVHDAARSCEMWREQRRTR
jgi:hypothetical protein